MDTLKDAGRVLLSSASMIVALLGALQIVTLPPEGQAGSLTAAIMLAIVALFYGWLVHSCVNLIRPVDMHLPVKSDWDVLEQAFAKKTKEEALKKRLSACLKAIEDNEPLIERQKRLAVRAKRLTMATVAVLLRLGMALRFIAVVP